MVTFAIVVRKYGEDDYKVSHIREATHLIVSLDGKNVTLYPIKEYLKGLQAGERGPRLAKYIKEEVLEEGRGELDLIDVLVTITEIQVDGPWRRNVPAGEDSDAAEVIKRYLNESDRNEDRAALLYY